MWPSLKDKLSRYEELETLLGDPAVVTNPTRYAQVAREHGSLAKLIKPYREFAALERTITALEADLATEADPDMRELAEAELGELRPRREQLRDHIEEMMLVHP